MTSFKVNIADPKTGKCYKTEVKDEKAAPFMGLNIGEKIEGNKLGIDGYEFSISGGTDYCGFPMRRGILGVRKRLTIYPGIGFKGGLKGMKKRKTICGHKINENIAAINLKVLKEGTKKLSDMFGKKEEGKEEAKEEPKKEAKQEKKPEVKEEPKKEAKLEQKEAKAKEEKQETKKNQ
jgi:small subunit ribosomal protein S6e